MKETPRRRITVTSSLNEISTDQLGNIVVFQQQSSGYIFKDDVNGFSSIWDIFFMVKRQKNISRDIAVSFGKS
jgi:hypothetical protein